MSGQSVYILGGAQTDFSRNFAREKIDIAEVVREVADETMQAAQLEPAEIEAIHVGNAFGELFNRQAQMGALLASSNPAYWGKPASRHEAACASGSIAILAAMAEIEAGRYDCILVLGVEQERNVQGLTAARHLGTAAWTDHEAQDQRLVWPSMFSDLAEEYNRRYGLQYAHLAAIAENNFANARRNPLAQTRNWQFPAGSFSEDNELNPVVAGWTRRQDCGQVTDGAAAVVLASAAFAKAWAKSRGKDFDTLPRIAGWGHRTAGLSLQDKFKYSESLVFPHMQKAILDAFRRAEIADVWQLDGIETHDCFAMTQYCAIDHFGITTAGQSWRAIEDGSLTFEGKLPINPSGGLIGAGHPVGASGIRMLWDAARQVSNTAGECQIPGAERFATLNLGGSATTVVSFVVASN